MLEKILKVRKTGLKKGFFLKKPKNQGLKMACQKLFFGVFFFKMKREPEQKKDFSTDFRGKIPRLLVKVKKLKPFRGELPEYKSQGASAFDIRACLKKDITLPPGERVLIPTGLSFEIPPGFEFQARPRSGWALKQGLTVLNSPGTIDSDYRGEVKVLVLNTGQKNITIKDQDRVAQLALCPVFKAEFIEEEELSHSRRGGGGFGSTGL